MIRHGRFLKMILFGLAWFTLTGTQNGHANPIGPYFGQTPPGDTAQVFAPDFISRSGWWVQNCSFSSDGREFIFCLTDKDWAFSSILYTHCFNNNEWSEPVKIIDNGLVPYFSHDDQAIYFISFQRNGTVGADVWISKRNGDTWQEPVHIDAPVSVSDGDEWEVAEPADGILYYSSSRPGGYGDMDIYRSVLANEHYLAAENPGAPINTASKDECPWVAPDESTMVFNSWRSNPNFSGNNLYVSWHKADGTWTNPKDLGAAINTNALDIYPYISPDGKYLFYTIRKTAYGGSEPSKLYWINTDFLQKMRTTNFAPYIKGSIEPVTVSAGAEFSFQIPDSLFFDDDGDSLSYSIAKSSGDSPEWLHFDVTTRTLSGTPPKVEKMSLRITATDPAGEPCRATFRLIIEASSEVGQCDELPQDHQLEQNYPNPFNPETIISYELPFKSHMTLTIFDLLGQEVTILVNGERSAGKQSVSWNASDFESGIYFYCLKAGLFTETKKMMLLR